MRFYDYNMMISLQSNTGVLNLLSTEVFHALCTVPSNPFWPMWTVLHSSSGRWKCTLIMCWALYVSISTLDLGVRKLPISLNMDSRLCHLGNRNLILLITEFSWIYLAHWKQKHNCIDHWILLVLPGTNSCTRIPTDKSLSGALQSP